MSKWTPGPWRLNPCSHGGLILVRDEITQTHLQIVPEADAHLIAAAPALAEALRELLAAVDGSPGAVATADAVNHARAALRAAEGES